MSDMETRVRDAIATNVDSMDGSADIIEKAISSAGHARRRRRAQRAMAGALVVTAGVGSLVGVVVANRGDNAGVSVSAGASSSSVSTPPSTQAPAALPSPSALVDRWNASCGTAPRLSPVAGLRFTLQLASSVVTPGAGTRAALVFENTTDKEVQVGTGVGAWYVSTPTGRLVGTSAGYPVILIGYSFTVAARRFTIPFEPEGFIGSLVGACTTSGGDAADLTAPLPRGHYLAWFGIPDTKGGMFVSEPAPFEVGGALVWPVPVTRAQALAKGRLDAIDPETTGVQAKLASWKEIRDAGAAVGSSPSDKPERRVWVVAVLGPVHRGMCCLVTEPPFRWGVVFIDAATGDAFQYAAGWKGAAPAWFASLPDHGA